MLVALPGTLALVVLARWGINRDPWLDEAFSVAAIDQLGTTFDRTAYTMATFYAQLKVWATPSTDLGWLRALPVLHAAASLLVLGVLVTRTHGRQVAGWAALFAGTSWMVVRYAHELRSFAFVLLLVTLGWLATDHLVERPDHRGWIACSLVVGVLAPLSHGLAVLAIGWQAVALLVSGAGRRSWFAAAPGWVLAVVVTGLLYRAGGADLGGPAVATDLQFVTRILELFHGGPRSKLVPFEGWWVLVAVTIYGLVVSLPRIRHAEPGSDRFRAVMPVAWGVGTLAGLFVLNALRPGVHVRYVVGAAPGLALLWSVAAVDVAERISRSRNPLSRLGRLPLVALVIFLLLLGGQQRYHESLSNRWTRITSSIAAEARPGDAVAILGPARPLFDVAWSRLDDPPELASIGHIQPLGTVRRYNSRPPGQDTHRQLAFTERLWLLERLRPRDMEMYRTFVERFVEGKGFVERSSREFGEVRLHLFEKEGAAGPAGALPSD